MLPPPLGSSTSASGASGSGAPGPAPGSTAPPLAGNVAGSGSSAPSTTPAEPMPGGGDPQMPLDPMMMGPVAEPPPPLTGDPNGSGEVVSIPEVKCGPAAGLDAFVAGTGIPGPGTPNLKVGGRDVVLSYPCDLREGAHVTFILNLHGTMPDEALKTYQHGYFSAHKLATSHRLIVATPMSKSPLGQWGNGDGGVDAPHLYEVVQWVYDHFGKFQIAGMWIGGHSWGSMFAKRFVCDPMFEGKVRGVIGMSGGATLADATCAPFISQIHTNGELEGGESGVPDQTSVAGAHGCDARLAPVDIGNGQMLYEWPNCDPGFVHFNFVMGAHEHITAMDDPVVLHIVEAIKSTE